MMTYQASITDADLHDVPLHEEMDYFQQLHPVHEAPYPLTGMLRTLSDPYYSHDKFADRLCLGPRHLHEANSEKMHGGSRR